MALVPMKKLLDDAVARNGAFGAFSVANMEMVDGTVRAAEEMQTDIVLQMDESWFPAVPFRLMAPMMIRAAKEAKVNIAVHLDHGQSPRLIRKALKEGFTSVMFDGSTMPFRGNILRTREVVAAAGKYGATVEAELGQIGNNDGRTSSAHRLKLTDPMDALQFVQRTGVDALAVSIGNANGSYPAAPHLEYDVLSEISQKTGVPLVLHGGSGLSEEEFAGVIRRGVRKINIATASFQNMMRAAQGYLQTAGHPDVLRLGKAESDGVYENVKRHIRVFNRAGSV